MKNIIWTVVASCAACASALFSVIGLGINIYYNRKMYKANLEIKTELDLLDNVKELVPKYISEVESVCFLYQIANANDNDNKGSGNINFSDYNKQREKAKEVRNQLDLALEFFEAPDLCRDEQIIWSTTKYLGYYFNRATNSYLSDKEKEFYRNFAKLESLMTKDCSDFYRKKFQELTK